MRKPSLILIKELVKEYLNPRSSLKAENTIDNDLIRIPDIYDVHLTFTSLLPNNFNNFLFANYANQTLKTTEKIYQESFLNPVANKLGKITQEIWDKTTSNE